MQVQVSITGDKQVMAMLDRTAHAVADLKEPLTDAAKYLTSYYSGVAFVSRGSVFGQRWPALSPAYERRKLKKYGSRPMLVASGAMQKSFKYKVTPSTATIFNDVRNRRGYNYFQAHQLGSGHMAKRAMFGVNNTVQNSVNQIFARYLAKMVGR